MRWLRVLSSVAAGTIGISLGALGFAVVAPPALAAGCAPHGVGTGCGTSSKVSLKVSPSKGLKNGQTVTVKGAGFVPNAQGGSVGVEMCAKEVTSNSSCDAKTAKVTKETNGKFTVSFPVEGTLSLSNGTTLKCTGQGNCSIGASGSFTTGVPGAYEDVGFK